MAIDAETINAPPEPPPLGDGVELYCVESKQRLAGLLINPSGEEADLFSGLTLMLAFGSSSRDRSVLSSLRHALSFADCTSELFAVSSWQNRLRERLSTVEQHFATAAIFVSSQTDVVSETVQAAIDVLRRSCGSTLAAVLVVSDQPNRWSHLTGVSGFVRAVSAESGADTARAVFLVLATLIAPKTLNGIDVEDLLPVLGPAQAPTELAELLWRRDDGGHLFYLSRAAEQSVRHAARLVAIPFVPGLGLDELRRFRDAVCREAPAADAVFFAPVDALRPGLLSATAGFVPVLCLQPNLVAAS